MKKGLIVLLVAIIMISMMLSGCTSDNNNNNQNNNQQNNEVSNQNEDSNNQNEDSNNQNGENSNELYTPVGEYPIVNEKIELDILVPNSSEIIDFETNEFTKYAEELTNIHINWDLAPSDNATEKLNLVLASGDYPDVFYGFTMSPDIVANYGVEQKVFTPLNDLIQNKTIHYKEMLETLPIEGATTATDGNIYGLASWNECYHCTFAQKYWINSFWIDELGLEMPETTEEFYQVLKAFKEDDPNKNGIADEVPLAGATNGWNTQLEHFLINSFVYSPNMYDKIKVVIEEDKVKTIANEEGYKEALKYIKKLYDEELIYSESFIQPQDQLRQLATNQDAEILGTFSAGHIGVVIEAASSPERYKHYETLAPLEGPDGIRYATHDKYFAIRQNDFVINSDSEYKEAAIRWADYQFSFEGNRRKYGWRPGIEYTMDVEGKKGLDGEPAMWELLIPYSNEAQNRGYMSTGLDTSLKEWRFGQVMEEGITKYDPEGLEILLYEETANKYEPYAPGDELSVKPIINLLADEAESIQVIVVELGKYIEESRMKFIMGEWNFEEDWDEYVKGLDSIGLQTYLDIMQKGYDRQYMN